MGLLKIKKIDGNMLKWIALIAMVIDHIGAVYLSCKFLKTNRYIFVVNYDFIYNLYFICRIIGRISFPIFAYLIVDGFVHTHNIIRYIIRLIIFSIISEIPFNLAISGHAFYINQQNVMITYLIAVCMLYLNEIIVFKISNIFLIYIIKLIVVIFSCFISMLCNSDYSWYGILLIYIFYEFRNKKNFSIIMFIVLNITYSILTFSILAVYSLFSIVFLLLYNGNRGRQNKYFFYIFYPLHLLILYVLTLI